jgi:hypothetical protein
MSALCPGIGQLQALAKTGIMINISMKPTITNSAVFVFSNLQSTRECQHCGNEDESALIFVGCAHGHDAWPQDLDVDGMNPKAGEVAVRCTCTQSTPICGCAGFQCWALSACKWLMRCQSHCNDLRLIVCSCCHKAPNYMIARLSSSA